MEELYWDLAIRIVNGNLSIIYYQVAAKELTCEHRINKSFIKSGFFSHFKARFHAKKNWDKYR